MLKKVIGIICLTLLLCGCGKETKEDVIKDFTEKINSTKSYKIEGSMEISNDEETFTYSLESYYLKDNYYKVILVNQTNNHEQIILKNNNDIYVITPVLNKSFKFQSEWPGNSSQAYLLGNLVNDINNDKNVESLESENGYILKSTVNYPNNEELKYQKIYLNDDKVVEKVEVFNNNDIVKIKVVFENVDLKAKLSEKDFKLNNYIKEENTDIENKGDTPESSSTSNEETKCEESSNNASCKTENNSSTENNQESQNNENLTQNNNQDNTQNSSTIENIIYPLYIPSNTYLTSSETIETTNGNRIILTFSGDKNFVLIEEPMIASNEMEIIPVYGEPLMLSESIGALSANSLSWDSNNISYYLASTELTVNEMQTIANSLGNSTLVAGTK